MNSVLPEGTTSLDDAVNKYEADLIKSALTEAGGSVTRAAKLLNITHQGLAFILNNRQSDLLSLRTPAIKRRRSVIHVNSTSTRNHPNTGRRKGVHTP